jgi:hypothetical protein
VPNIEQQDEKPREMAARETRKNRFFMVTIGLRK